MTKQSNNYINAKMALNDFMCEFRVGKNHPITHTMLEGGSFCIHPEDMDQFMKLYDAALESGAPLSITEAHQSISPIVLDFDLKQGDNPERLYDLEEHIKPIINALGLVIADYIQKPKFTYFFLEKPSPRPDPSKPGCFKDGFHIHFPYIVTCPEIQHAIRKDFLDNHVHLLDIPGVTNPPNDIYDEAVIQRNNWLMYGSKKPNEEFPWTVSRMYTDDKEAFDNNAENKKLHSLLSIRHNVGPECVYTVKGTHTKKSLSSAKQHSKSPTHTSHSFVTTSSKEDHTDLATKLTDALSPRRAEDYDPWMKLGWCLHNINEKKLLPVWIKFSQQSTKFREGECEKKWADMTDRGLTIYSLRSWVKEDNPPGYRDIMQSYKTSAHIDIMDNDEKYTLLENVRNKDLGMSELVYKLFKDTIKYVHKDVYYMFNEHETMWMSCTEKELYYIIMSKLTNILNELYAVVSEEVPNESETEVKRNELQKKMIMAMADKVKTSQGIASIMKTASVHFKNRNFHNELDCFPYLLGVKNGVVDLRTGELRPRQPQDMILNICDVEYDPDAPTDLIESVLTSAMAEDTEMVSFLQKLLGYAITGETKEEIFIIMTGTGRNCKSLISHVLQLIMKSMCVEMNTGVIIENKNVANMDAERCKIQGRRIIVFNELSSGDRMRMDTVKLFSGGDIIPATAKYEAPIEIIPRQQCILNTNCLPVISDVDIAIIERLICIHFPVTFTELEPGEKPTLYKRQRDNDLKDKLKNDLEGVFNWLVKGAVRWYANPNIKKNAPKKVKEFGRGYLEEQDKVKMFIKECCDVKPNNRVSSVMLLNYFNNWSGENYNSRRFAESMKKYGYEKKCLRINGQMINSYKGISMLNYDNEE